MRMDEVILQFLGKVLAYGGGGAAAAYLVFTFFGKKLIDRWFAERLEITRHELNKQLEETRYKMNSLFNRVTKIHEKEFEVLPEAWHKMQDALGRISGLTSLFHQYPDINRMSPAALQEFLAKSILHEFEKQELLQADDKMSYYQDKMFWHELRVVEEAFFDFHNYIVRNKIFLSLDLQEQFTKVDDVMRSAIVERKVGHEADDHQMWVKAYKKIKEEVNPIRDTIEKQVQTRLHYHEAE
jgi:hypothetical protein